jgi:hypothetical protein
LFRPFPIDDEPPALGVDVVSTDGMAADPSAFSPGRQADVVVLNCCVTETKLAPFWSNTSHRASGWAMKASDASRWHRGS